MNWAVKRPELHLGYSSRCNEHFRSHVKVQAMMGLKNVLQHFNENFELDGINFHS